MKKRLIALLLTFALLLTLIPAPAFAEKSDTSDPSESDLPFTDVTKKDWFYDAVSYVYHQQIFNGVSDTLFSPRGNMTRAMFVSVLSRMARAEETEFGTESAFSDTKSDFWYTSPINWAVAFKITTGTGNGKFSPNSSVTREQIAVFFARYLDAYGVVLPDSDQVSGPPQDLMSASDWARDDIMTLWKTGLMIGDGKNFNPKKLCTRAEGATMCMRIYDYIRKAQNLLLDYDLDGKDGDDSIGASDVAADFTLKLLSSDASMSRSDVLNGLSAKNLTDPDAEHVIQISGGNGTFVISGCHEQLGNILDGFAPGSTFKIQLNDSRLFFEGVDENIREYDFTTKQEEVKNIQLSPAVVYLPITALSELMQNGELVQMVDASLFSAGTELSVNDLTVGSFHYDGSDIGVDSIVAVYTAGSDPDAIPGDETFDGEVGYIKITECNDSLYSFTNAQTEDVLFFPDILPIPASADLNTDGKDNTVQVNASVLDFSGDDFAHLGLDSTTVPEPGDYLVFYTGSLTGGTVNGYGRIVDVDLSGDVYTLTYASADWDDVSMAMELFTTEPVTGEELLEDTDLEELEQSILVQAVESGFAEAAAHYLTAVALDTEIDGESIAGDVLECYSFTDAEGVPIPEYEARSAAKKGSVSVGNPELKVKITTNTQKIDSGLRILLDVGLTITIKPGDDSSGGKTSKGDNDSNGAIEITLKGQFVEELGMSFDVTGKAEWDVWGIFPYISDYTVTGNVDVYDFTGINFNATIKTVEDNDDFAINSIADKIKYLLDLLDDAEEGYFSEDLSEKYSTMLEEDSDLIDLLRVEIVKKEFNVPSSLPIIDIVLEADFVIKADAVISAGLDFGFTNGKRYVFNFSVFGHTATNDVITLQPDTYDLTVYVMGHLELRAGIELIFQIGLLSTEIDNVGFTADVGAYLELYGYFYYQYHRVSGSPAETHWSGALYIEIGIYLKLSFNAEVKGILSTSLTLYEKKWPLWRIGEVDNVLDFTTPEEKVPEITLKQYIRNTYLPESLFTMDSMNMKTGKKKDICFDDDTESRFTISFTNSKFSYDPKTNMISVHPDEDDVRLEGTMSIIYNLAPLAFSSEPIQRTLRLSWSNLKDGYVIMPYSNGGSYVQPINQKYETSITAPPAPERKGYLFDGWFTNQSLTSAYSFPKTMPAEDVEIYAKWRPASNTPYSVEHWQQKLGSDTYELVDTEEFTGTTDNRVTPATRSYPGFTSPKVQELTITADGAATLCYYYTRNKHTLTFDASSVGSLCNTMELYYGASVSVPKAAQAGYLFEGWYDNPGFAGAPFTGGKMPDMDKTYYAKFVRDEVTLYPYRVEYYLLTGDGNYKLQHSETHSALAGTILPLASLQNYEPLSEDASKERASITVDGAEIDPGKDSIIVAGDHELIIKVKYRNKPISNCVLSYQNMDGAEVSSLPSSADSFTKVTLPDPSKTYYTFDGWYYDETLKDPVIDENPDAVGTAVTITKNTTFYAGWRDNFVLYTLYNNLGDQNTSIASLKVECGKSASLPTIAEIEESGKNIKNAGYSFQGWATSKNGSAEFSDGQAVKATAAAGTGISLWAAWDLVTYHYTLVNQTPDSSSTLSGTTEESYTVLSDTIIFDQPKANPGYEFLGWFDEDDHEVKQIPHGSTGDCTVTAKWAHGGIFDVRFEYDESNQGTSVYTVTRTLPYRCSRFTDDTQYVFYRTLNRTAIGGTASAVHFSHVGGNDVYLTFGPTDTQATFEVKNKNPAAIYTGNGTASYPATAWTYYTSRNYLAGIYRITSAQNRCTGLLGENNEPIYVEDYSLTNPSEYRLTKEAYTKTYTKAIYPDEIIVTDDFYFSTDADKCVTYDPFNVISSPGGSSSDDAFRTYLKATGSEYRFTIQADIQELDDGYQWFRFETMKGNSVYSTGTFKYSYEPEGNELFLKKQELPINKTVNYLAYMEDELDNFKAVKDGNYWKLLIDKDVTAVRITFDASGNDDDDWTASNICGRMQIHDTRSPQQIGVAPLSFGTYQAGDPVNIAVVYDEIITSYGTITPNTPILDYNMLKNNAGISVGGISIDPSSKGTNIILFTCIATEPFTVTPNTNHTLIDLKPANLVVTDIANEP